MKHVLDPRQLAAVLAGLRTIQAGINQGQLALNEDEGIEDVLTDGGTLEPLTVDEIDELCESLNAEAAREDEGRQRWVALCDQQGWNEESQIIHLEGFIASQGLFDQFADYASVVADEENGDTAGES